MTLSGWVYTSFIMDLYSRRIVGWQVAGNLRSDTGWHRNGGSSC
ncbi:MAG: hypothetical protein ACRDNW_12680 [Trebonia sp.]